ncbi:hypothetical protein StoSoilB20_13500 [Arthrobacter sp. StoSoilB20]|nr:hypothetical protein StoSoilB20_13500 [Arthrobacter sp. StoSoilB20]
MLAPHVLEPLRRVQNHVIKALCAGSEAGKAGEHEFSPQSPAMAVAPAPPETPRARTGVLLCLIAIGVSPPDVESGNMWL